jgi:hypothetical protein
VEKLSPALISGSTDRSPVVVSRSHSGSPRKTTEPSRGQRSLTSATIAWTGWLGGYGNLVVLDQGAVPYADAGLAAGTYYYKVTAQDAAGNVSPPSSQASAAATAIVKAAAMITSR